MIKTHCRFDQPMSGTNVRDKCQGHMFRVEFAALPGQMYSSSGTDVQGQLFSGPHAPSDEARGNNCLSWGVKWDQHTKQWKSNHASQGFYLWIRLCMLNIQKSKNKYDWGKVPRMEAKYLAFPLRSWGFLKSILNLRHMNHEHIQRPVNFGHMKH